MIRSLRPGENPPPGEPRRSRSSHGYVRLRWKVGVESYVETYEHRLVAGLPDAHVHHRDEDKTNNAPGNLEALTPTEHQQHHVAELRAAGAYKGSARDRERAARRAASEAWWAEIAAAHHAGESTAAIGRRIGRAATNVSRGLHKRGYAVSARPGWDYDARPAPYSTAH